MTEISEIKAVLCSTRFFFSFAIWTAQITLIYMTFFQYWKLSEEKLSECFPKHGKINPYLTIFLTVACSTAKLILVTWNSRLIVINKYSWRSDAWFTSGSAVLQWFLVIWQNLFINKTWAVRCSNGSRVDWRVKIEWLHCQLASVNFIVCDNGKRGV